MSNYTGCWLIGCWNFISWQHLWLYHDGYRFVTCTPKLHLTSLGCLMSAWLMAVTAVSACSSSAISHTAPPTYLLQWHFPQEQVCNKRRNNQSALRDSAQQCLIGEGVFSQKYVSEMCGCVMLMFHIGLSHRSVFQMCASHRVVYHRTVF